MTKRADIDDPVSWKACEQAGSPAGYQAEEPSEKAEATSIGHGSEDAYWPSYTFGRRAR